MASATDTVTVLSIPFAGQAATDRVTYRAERLRIATTMQDVGSVHTSADSDTTYISNCNCCYIVPCILAPCSQCTNGYASNNLSISVRGGVADHFFLWSNGVYIRVDFPWFGLASVGDCVWEGYGPVEFEIPFIGFIRLYYSTGWKLFVDYGQVVSSVYVSSGNGITYSLDNPFICCDKIVASSLTVFTDPPAPLTVDGLHKIYFRGCGCKTYPVSCCSEEIPNILHVTPDCVDFPSSTVSYVSTNTWKDTDGASDTLELTCERYPTGADPFKFVLRIYDYPGHTLLATAVASTTTCYPIYLEFTGISIAAYCGGTPFTITITV